MSYEVLSRTQIAEITSFVDIEAPPPHGVATALVIFGTNQVQPVEIAAERYHRGLAPMIIATGGVNRHNGIVEGRWFRRLLLDRGVPDQVIRYEDQSTNTWENVENSLPHLEEALAGGLSITAVSKWYHRRTVNVLATLVPEIGPFYGLSWEPTYEDKPITREDWPLIPAGKRRVLREWQEVSRREADGSLKPVSLVSGAWCRLRG